MGLLNWICPKVAPDYPVPFGLSRFDYRGEKWMANRSANERGFRLRLPVFAFHAPRYFVYFDAMLSGWWAVNLVLVFSVSKRMIVLRAQTGNSFIGSERKAAERQHPQIAARFE